MRRYSWRRFLERRMQLAKHQFYHFHSVFSICVDYLFSSATNFRSFSVGSLSIKDLVKVRKLGSMVSLFFFGLHSPSYLLLHSYYHQIIFEVSILTVIVKSWLNDIRRIYRFPILYQWEKNIPPFSIAFFHLVTTNPTQWYTNQRVTRYELMSLRVSFIARVMSYELFLLHELRVTFCIRVTGWFLYASHELLFNYELQ